MQVITSQLSNFNFTLTENRNIIPHNDSSTLFVVAGMQPLKDKFLSRNPKMSTLQSCVRTNDIDDVGDGTHLTSFNMLGSFGFQDNSYPTHIELWHNIIQRLCIPITHITYHPNTTINKLWEKYGYNTIPDESCVWSMNPTDDPSYCSEMFCDDLEVGNLVNTNGNSVDVGFGLERIFMMYENKNRIDETSLFDTSLSPVVRDHVRTISLMKENDIHPGNKGREYVCRRLVRNVIRENVLSYDGIEDILEKEKISFDKRIREGRKSWKKYQDKDNTFWWESFGILPEEMHLLS